MAASTLVEKIGLLTNEKSDSKLSECPPASFCTTISKPGSDCANGKDSVKEVPTVSVAAGALG